MSLHRHRRVLAFLTAAPLAITLAACSGSSGGDGDTDADAGQTPAATCPTDLDATASTQPPSDIPTPDGADSAYEYFAQGATKVFNFALDGEGGDLVSLRDAYDAQLKDKGYDIKDTDAEEGFEAESEFDGPHDGTTNFRVLCEGKVVFRLKLES